jgi:membrane-bound lytic murein transglycosylase D
MSWKFFLITFVSVSAFGAVEEPGFIYTKPNLKTIEQTPVKTDARSSGSLMFDLPITYNDQVKFWINYYQTIGKKHFTSWLERSARTIPRIQAIFKEKGMPLDLAYLAMIESGLSPFALSSAQAVGYWQFIAPTAQRYGLKVNWWLDERRDIYKSTQAAARYLSDMHKMFDSWYLAAAGYNAGESRIKRLMEKHNSKDFWDISQSLVQETKDYVPKLIAAILIAKAPSLYGFRDLKYKEPLSYEYIWAPGGTSLKELANSIHYPEKDLRFMNPELLRGYIPDYVSGHRIRIPKGSLQKVSLYFRNRFQ